MSNWTIFAVLFWTAVGIAACGEESFDPLPDGRDYYPLEIGSFLEYRYDSIIFDDFEGGNVQDTFSGFIREEIIDTVMISGNTEFVVRRSVRSSEGLPWITVAVVSAHTDATYAYRQGNNLRLLKMRFPLRSNSEWEPTKLIDPETEITVGTETIEMFSNWAGAVKELGQPEVVGEFSFDEVMTCVQADDDNEIERRYVQEKYALGVGLVYRRDTILDSRCKRLGELTPCLNETWSEKGEKGYILEQVITRYQ